MPSQKFDLASSLRVAPSVALVDGVPSVLWESVVTQGTGYNSARLFVTYHSVEPDSAVVSPFGFSLLVTVEEQQEDGAYEEIGRQNVPIAKLEQGAEREIYIGPQVNVEEGIDFAVAGFDGITQRLKSMWQDVADGPLRVRLHVIDKLASGANPFVACTFSAHLTRFDS